MKLEQLFRINSYTITRSGKGVLLNLSAFDKEKKEWINVTAYVPFQIVTTEKDKATANILNGKVSGKKLCRVCIDSEYIPQGKDVFADCADSPF